MWGKRCVSGIQIEIFLQILMMKSKNVIFWLWQWRILFDPPYIKTFSNFLNLTILGKIQKPSDNDSKLNECLCLVRWMVTLHKRGIMIYYTICPIHCGFRFNFCLSIVRLGFIFFTIITFLDCSTLTISPRPVLFKKDYCMLIWIYWKNRLIFGYILG